MSLSSPQINKKIRHHLPPMFRTIVFITVMHVLCNLAYREGVMVASVGGSSCPTEAVLIDLTPSCQKEALIIEKRRHLLDACHSIFLVPLACMHAGAADVCNCIKREKSGACDCQHMLHNRNERHSKEKKCSTPVLDRLRISMGLCTRRCYALLLVWQVLLHKCICYNIGRLCRSADILVWGIPILFQISLLPYMNAADSGKKVPNQTVKCKQCRVDYSHSRYIGVCTLCGNSYMMKIHMDASEHKKTPAKSSELIFL